METRVQTILGPDWNRGFNAQTTLTILTQKSRTHQAAFGFGIVSIARVIACRLREMAYGIGPPFRKPAARSAAQMRATPSRGGRRADVNRDWLFEQLLFIWEQCGGATRTSTHGGRDARRGGPLVRFLMAACGPLFQACKREAPKHDAMRGAVRKLLKERKPQPR